MMNIGPVAMVCVMLPIKVISEANRRDHWRKSAARRLAAVVRASA